MLIYLYPIDFKLHSFILSVFRANLPTPSCYTEQYIHSSSRVRVKYHLNIKHVHMIDHLVEIRQRAIRIFIIFLGIFSLFFFFANDLFYLVCAPVQKVLPLQSSLIATGIGDPLFAPIHLAFNLALWACCPFFLLELWLFCSPGLYKKEKQQTALITFLGVGLFCMGGLFCYYIFLPYLTQFFVASVPQGVLYLPGIVSTINFITKMMLIFGVIFEIPFLCVLFVQYQICTIKQLRIVRPYVIVSSFIIGMLLTPPDVISQIMLALPMCLLYEIGLLLAQWKSKALFLSEKKI